MITKGQKALLHIAKAEVGMTEEEYRDLLKSVGVESSADPKFNRAKFDQVMKHFKTLGFKKRLPRRPSKGETPRNDRGAQGVKGVKSKEKLLAKIDAILNDLGLKRGYADSMARSMFGVDFVSWCDADQLYKITAALTYHQNRQAARGERQGEGPEVA